MFDFVLGLTLSVLLFYVHLITRVLLALLGSHSITDIKGGQLYSWLHGFCHLYSKSSGIGNHLFQNKPMSIWTESFRLNRKNKNKCSSLDRKYSIKAWWCGLFLNLSPGEVFPVSKLGLWIEENNIGHQGSCEDMPQKLSSVGKLNPPTVLFPTNSVGCLCASYTTYIY